MFVVLDAENYVVGDRAAWPTPEEAWEYAERRAMQRPDEFDLSTMRVCKLVVLKPVTKTITTFEETN